MYQVPRATLRLWHVVMHVPLCEAASIALKLNAVNTNPEEGNLEQLVLHEKLFQLANDKLVQNIGSSALCSSFRRPQTSGITGK